MSKSNRVRIAVEGFEERLTPAVTAVLDAGTLRVTGAASEPTAGIRLVQSAAGTFQVFDGTSKVGQYAVTKDVAVGLTKASDKVEVNLGGFAFAGNVLAELGDGDNLFRLSNGSAKSLTVRGGAGKDDIGVRAFSSDGVLLVTAGDGADLVVLDGAVAVGELNVGGAETVTFGAGTKVARATNVTSGAGKATVSLAGSYAGPTSVVTQLGGVAVTAPGQFSDLTVQAVGSPTAAIPPVGSSVTLTGRVAGTFTVRTGAGNDTVALALGSAVGKGAVVGTGDGADVVTVAGTVGPADAKSRTLTVETGGGEDRVELAGGAKVSGEAFVNLGAGTDRFTLNPNALFGRLEADGGEGKDTFAGNKLAVGLTLLGFEVFV